MWSWSLAYMDQKKIFFARVPKAALTSNHQTVSYVFVALSTYTPVPFCHSCISCLYYFACLSCQGCPKIPISMFKRGGGLKRKTEQLLRFYFPLEEWQIAMSSKHLMYLANYLDLLFHLIDRQLSLRRPTNGNEQFVKVLLSITQVVQTRQFIKICGEGNLFFISSSFL